MFVIRERLYAHPVHTTCEVILRYKAEDMQKDGTQTCDARDVHEICVLLGPYAALPTFRDDLSVPFLRVKKSKKKSRMGSIIAFK